MLLQRVPGVDAAATPATPDAEGQGGSITPRSRGATSEAAARAAAIARSGGGANVGGDVDSGEFEARVKAGEHAEGFQFHASDGTHSASEVRAVRLYLHRDNAWLVFC